MREKGIQKRTKQSQLNEGRGRHERLSFALASSSLTNRRSKPLVLFVFSFFPFRFQVLFPLRFLKNCYPSSPTNIGTPIRVPSSSCRRDVERQLAGQVFELQFKNPDTQKSKGHERTVPHYSQRSKVRRHFIIFLSFRFLPPPPEQPFLRQPYVCTIHPFADCSFYFSFSSFLKPPLLPLRLVYLFCACAFCLAPLSPVQLTKRTPQRSTASFRPQPTSFLQPSNNNQSSQQPPSPALTLAPAAPQRRPRRHPTLTTA